MTLGAGRATQAKLITFRQSDSAYATCLYAALASLGVRVTIGPWSGHWLLDTVRRGDVIHIHWPSFFYYDSQSRWNTYTRLLRFLTVLELARARGARIVWTAHNLYPHDGGKKRRVHRIARQYVARFSERILVHGMNAARMVADEFGIPSEKLIMIQHGHWIDHHAHTLSSAAARKILDVPNDVFVYSFVGACKPYKNIELLIDTFANLEDDSLLIIAGYFQSKIYRARIQSMLDRLPGSRWRFEPNFIPDNEMQRYILAGDVLVLPYAEILTSGSAMLGLSFGRPVIAPDAGNLRDMIDGECGELYDRAVLTALFQAMQRIRTRRFDAETIIAKARSFDWLESARVLANLLEAQ